MYTTIMPFCSPRSHTFKGNASLLSALTVPHLGNTGIAQEMASLPGQYEYCPGSSITPWKIRCTSAMAVASPQHGSFM